MRPLAAALRFFTVLPLPPLVDEASLLARSTPWWPVVGVVVGGLAAVWAWLFSVAGLPLAPSVVLVMAFWQGLTGGLHLDGLADTADGLGSHRPAAQALAIMRDSCIGVMGMLALLLVLGLKAACLAALPRVLWPSVILCAAVNGRSSQMLLWATLPYARSQGGMASLFQDRHYGGLLAWGVLLTVTVALASGGVTALGAVAAGLVATLALRGVLQLRLGGYTGDTLGAAHELAEAVTLLGWLLVYTLRGLKVF